MKRIAILTAFALTLASVSAYAFALPPDGDTNIAALPPDGDTNVAALPPDGDTNIA